MRTVDIPTAARAQTLRRDLTPAERKLWYKLRYRRLGGHKFVRQCPIGRYFADFACRERRLVVEVDGGQHGGSAYDERRDAAILEASYVVLRFWNAEVLQSVDVVCETILAALEGRLEPFERFKIGRTIAGSQQ